MTLFKKSAQQVRAQNTQTDYQGDFRKIKLIKVFNGSSVKSVILSQNATGISWYAWLVFFWWDLILLCFVVTLIAAAFQNPKLLFF